MNAIAMRCLAAILIATSAASAEEAPATPAPEVTAVSSAQDMDLRSMINSVSQKTHKRFIIDPRVRGSAAVAGIQARDVTYSLLLEILDVNGYVAYERDGVVRVLPDVYSRMLPSPVTDPNNIRAADAEIVTAVVPVKNVVASNLVPVMRPMLPQNAQLVAINGRNALLVVDRAANVRRLVSIVEQLDRLPETKEPKAKGE